MDVPHISAYGLTVEEKTPLYHSILKNKMPAPNEEDLVRQFEYTMEILQSAGYDHYEISNYAKPGHYSKHNTGYWTEIPYLGFGPSAHSFFHQTRGWNASSINAYREDISNNHLFSATEALSLSDRYNEYILTGLRTSWGIDLNYIEKTFGMTFYKKCLKTIVSMHDSFWIYQSKNILTLTKKGKLLADHIIGKMFV
jgi:oxygen-independent coproporphyrinogen-3 oxidase